MGNDKLLEQFYDRFNRYNTKVLELFGKTIAKFDGLTPSQAHKLAQQLKNGRDINVIIEELVKLSGLSKKDVIKVLENTAKNNIAFAQPYYEYRNIVNSYDQSVEFQEIVNSVAKITNNTFTNISKTTCIKLLKDNGKPLYLDIKKAYNEVIDRSVLAVTTGQQDFQSAMRDTIRQLSDSGVKKVYYDNGKPYAKRLDSTVRQNVLDGIRQVNMEIQEQIGEEIDADGVEVSHHKNPAPDHEHTIDGKQFTIEEFNKLNNKLARPVGTLNCYHYVFYIILGVQKPSYTKKELEQGFKENNKGFEFEGKKYTMYEGTQLQRNLETAIRKQKDRQIIARASGNLEEVDKAQRKIKILNEKYKVLSEVSSLPTRAQRLSISGYRKVKV